MEFKDLDPRLSRALSKLNFHKPTLIQEKAVPLALAGKDILARARTGSGKTAAYCLPIVQKILVAKDVSFISTNLRINYSSNIKFTFLPALSFCFRRVRYIP